MSLSVKYSRELEKGLGKVAVYLPGVLVDAGNIIRFPHEQKGIFRDKSPYGTFRKITSLDNLNVPFSIEKDNKNPDSYIYSSSDIRTRVLNMGVNSSHNSKKLPEEQLIKLTFGSEGALYFVAVDCTQKRIDDLVSLEKSVQDTADGKFLWNETYLVVSVFTAKKAFITQSKNRDSEIVLSGNVNINKAGINNLDARANLKLKSQKGNLFIKNWSENVTIFMDIVPFDKETFKKQ